MMLGAAPGQVRTLADQTNIFRASTVHAFLAAGLSLHKIEPLREYLEHYAHETLDDVSNLKQIYLPPMRRAIIDEVKAAITAGCKVCLVHDGTNRFSEFYSIVLRWSTADFDLEERIIAMKAFLGAQKGHELAHMIDEVLEHCGVAKGSFRADGTFKAGDLIATQRDRAMVNQKASNIVKLIYGFMDLECLSHTFCKVGEKMPLQFLSQFQSMVHTALNSHAFNAHVKTFLTKPLRKPSPTRWWSYWEMYDLMLSDVTLPDGTIASYFARLLQAIRAAVNDDGVIDLDGVWVDSANVLRLVEFAQTQTHTEDVLLELTVVVGVFRPFVQATYALEGAGCCVLEVGGWFHYLSSFWHMHEPTLSFPRVRVAIEKTAAARLARGEYGSLVEARLAVEARVRELIAPVAEQLSFVFNCADGEMKTDVRFYKFCVTLNPFENGKPHFQLEPEAFKVEVLHHFSGYLEPRHVDIMLEELPQFQLECVAFLAQYAPNDPDNNPDKTAEHRNVAIWSFWKRLHRECACPWLRRLAQLVLSIVPSSAAAERSFSLLKNYFQSQQLVGDMRGALEDYIELSVATSFATSNKNNKFHSRLHAQAAAPCMMSVL
jgi:hypothetical protein